MRGIVARLPRHVARTLQVWPLAAAAILVACGSETPTGPAPEDSSGSGVTTAVALSCTADATGHQCRASALASSGAARDVTTSSTWTSSNSAVATVDADGDEQRLVMRHPLETIRTARTIRTTRTTRTIRTIRTTRTTRTTRTIRTIRTIRTPRTFSARTRKASGQAAHLAGITVPELSTPQRRAALPRSPARSTHSCDHRTDR